MKFSLKTEHLLPESGPNFIFPFALIVSCFALWGFANDMTGPVVKAFSKIFHLSLTEGVLVTVASYLGYFVMAFPAAMFIQRYSFKAGVLTGLGLFALGTLLFLPAKALGFYYPFLLAYFILTCGLSFLETSCNPYVYCMGPEHTATQRLNLAQAFNPIGALIGMSVALEFIQNRMSPMSADARQDLPEVQFDIIKDNDLSAIIGPYLFMGGITVLLLLIIWITAMPTLGDTHKKKDLRSTMRQLFDISNYRYGVVTLFFYEGAQVACWTFILQYGTRVFMAEGMGETAAEILSQKYNITAMALFAVGRFVCFYLMRYVHPSRLLSVLAILACVFLMGTVLFPDRSGLYCLVAVSACMSLMFPTIYGVALRGVGDKIKFASAGLIMAILGASVLPPLQALVIDLNITFFGLSAVNVSFIIPLLCLAAVAFYGHRTYVRHHILGLEA